MLTCCISPFVDSVTPVFGKPKHCCASVVSVVILFIGMETSTTISRFYFTIEAINNDCGSSHYASPL